MGSSADQIEKQKGMTAKWSQITAAEHLFCVALIYKLKKKKKSSQGGYEVSQSFPRELF